MNIWRVILKGLGRQRVTRARRPLIVLAYHDLCEKGDIDSWMRIDVSRFREHVRLLEECGTLLGPDDLARLSDLPATGPCFLLTFDDGAANWLRLAVPVLQESAAQALFFVSTHPVLTGEPFWFDRVVWGLQSSDTVSVDLRSFGLRNYRFRRTHGRRRWDDIQRLMVDIKRLGNPADPSVERVIRRIESLGEPSRTDPHLRPLTVAELQQMACVEHCHFGSHGHRHQILTRLAGRQLSDDLGRSHSLLEEMTGQPVKDIAYPNGDCDGRVAQACREAGYERGFTVRAAAVSLRRADPYRMPRLLVGAYDSAETLAVRIAKLVLRTLRDGVGAILGEAASSSSRPA